MVKSLYCLPSKVVNMKHLTREQRYTISEMNEQGYSQKEIAKAIQKDKSTVSRELRRNWRLFDNRNQRYRLSKRHNLRLPSPSWSDVSVFCSFISLGTGVNGLHFCEYWAQFSRSFIEFWRWYCCSVTVNVWAWLSTAMSASVMNISWINFLSSFFSLFINGCDYILYGTFRSIAQHDDHDFELLALSFKVVESDLLMQLFKCYFIPNRKWFAKFRNHN